MKRSIVALVTLVLLFVTASLAQQSGWEWQNPKPQGSSLHGLAVIDEQTVVVVGDGGIIMRSTDRGQSWKFTSNPTVNRNNLFGVDFLGNLGWAVGEYGTMLRSTDGGLIWQRMESGITVDLVDVHIANETYIWSVGRRLYPMKGYIFTTSNGGSEWIEKDTMSYIPRSVFFTDSSHGIVAGEMSSIQTTFDGGSEWYRTILNPYIIWQSIYFTDFLHGWIVGRSGEVAITIDGGYTWMQHRVDSTYISTSSIFFVDQENGWACGPYGNIHHTTNAGLTWKRIGDIPLYTQLEAVRAFDRSSLIAVGTEGVIYTSDDSGHTWKKRSEHIGMHPYAIRFLNRDSGFAVGYGEIGRTTDGGQHWLVESLGLHADFYSMFFLNPNTGWIAGDPAIILKTTNGGIDWFSQYSNYDRWGYIPYSVFFSDEMNGWAVGVGLLLKTTNGGNDWENLDTTYEDFYSVYFTSSNKGFVGGPHGIIMTTDGGSTWTESSSYDGIFSLSFAGSQVGYAVGAKGVILKTSDGGMSWDQLSSPTSEDLNAVQFLGTANGCAVGDNGTILKTTDGGDTWISAKLNTRSTFSSVSFVDHYEGWICADDGTILHTSTGGIVPVKDVDNDSHIPMSIALSQNFPNPFNPTTTLTYDVAKTGSVALKIYDVLGREVATLVNEIKSPGSYSVQWNPSDKPSGIYFYRLSTSGYSITKKMVLIK